MSVFGHFQLNLKVKSSGSSQTIIKMGVANGVKRFWIGKDGLLSTRAVSVIIRERGPAWQRAFGSFILAASPVHAGFNMPVGAHRLGAGSVGGPDGDNLRRTSIQMRDTVFQPSLPHPDSPEPGMY